MGAHKWLREYYMAGSVEHSSVPRSLEQNKKKFLETAMKMGREMCGILCGNIPSELFTFSFQECSDKFWKHLRKTRPGTLRFLQAITRPP